MRDIRVSAFSSCVVVCIANSAFAAVIFESSTLGPTGVTKAVLLNQNVLGTNVDAAVFVGTRFQVTQTAVTSRIGGHFVGGFGSDLFFGTVVKLISSTDFPDSADLSTPDVIGQSWLFFPHPSREVFGDLSIKLEPGWYALVFGSGLFSAFGTGGAVRNGTDIGAPSYLGWQSGSTGWFNLDDLSGFDVFDNHRFVVEGMIIPEPSAVALLLFGLLSLEWLRQQRRCPASRTMRFPATNPVSNLQ